MRKKKLFNYILVFFICFGIFTFCVEALSISSNKASLNQIDIGELKESKLNLRQAEKAQRIEKLMEKENYPSYFGGTYISEDSTHVILQIVEGASILKNPSILNKVIDLGDEVEIQYVKYSYKELNDINDKLIEYYSSENSDISNLVAHYVDVFNNNVVVELKNNTSTQIQKVKKVAFGETKTKNENFNSDIIVFKEGKEHQTEIMNPGQGITTKGKPDNCSMGYRVKIDGSVGYLTSGHCFNGVGDEATGGKVTKWQRSDKVDAAFVKINFLSLAAYIPSNDLKYPDPKGIIKTLNNDSCPILSLNMNVAKSGNKTGYTTGKIKNLNYSANYEGFYQTGLVATDYVSTGGDSGSPVFVPENVNGGAPIAGLHIGTSSYGKAFVKADEIYLAFGYTRY